MLDGRYRDKKYLSKYDLSVELFEKFDLKVNDVVPIRHVYILSTDKGTKVLKRIDYSLEQLEFINNAVKYIKKKFDRVIGFVETIDKKVYAQWKNDIYCIMDLVEGKECEFSNPIDLNIASRGLGELHRASVGFKTNLKDKYTAGKTIDIYKRRMSEMEFFKSLANIHECKTAFDKIFLENVEEHMKDMEESIKILENSKLNELILEEDKVVLCHNDLAYHNILISNNEAYFVDFDYAVINLKVHDLSNFINKAIKNFAFDAEKAYAVLKDYCMENTLDERELKVLYGMLYFPEDFYSISKDYYTRRKDWDEEVFLGRMIKKVSYKEDRKDFLEEIKDKMIK